MRAVPGTTIPLAVATDGEAVSRPEHIREWWYAESDVQPTAGATGELVWADGDSPEPRSSR